MRLNRKYWLVLGQILRLDLKMLRVLAPASLLLPLFAVAAPPSQRQVYAMGTRLTVQLEGPAAEAALAEVERIEAACSTWRPGSHWSRLNATAGAWQPLDQEWLQLLDRAQAWSRRTGGAFDPVLRALLQARGVRPDGPGQGGHGCSLLELDPARGRARLLQGAGIEEGAFLKGYALDAARRASAATCGWLDLGGQLLAWGRPLRVEIADPRRRQVPRVALDLRDASLSTSGCSERGRHLVDPRTGAACPNWGSVSVVAPSAFDADVLSTALYVLGPEAGLAWAECNHLPALFLFADGHHRASGTFAALNPTFLSGECP